MKILQVTKQFPYPTKDGYSVAVDCLARAFNDLGIEVSLLSMNTTKHFFDLKKLPKDYDHYHTIHEVEVDNRITPWTAFFNLFSKTSFILSRFITEGFEEKLKVVLKSDDFDIVQLESVQLAPYIPLIRKYSKAKLAMRAHNVEFEIWERHLETTRFFLKKWYLKSQVKSLKKFEIESLNDYDILVAITERDLNNFRKLGFKNSGIVVPVGMDSSRYNPDLTCFSKPPGISFIGSLDWMPNQEGIAWFLENVWEQFLTQKAKATLHIAGRHAPKWLKENVLEGVTFHGEVESAKDFINAHSIMIVPLFSGSGIRVKILEGMALGRVIITTKLGMEGIGAVHREQILIAETPEDFVKELSFCFENEEAMKQISEQAKAFILEHFDSLTITKRLIEKYAQS